MEIHNKRLVTKQVEETVERYRVCDKCGKRIKTALFDAFDFDFELKIGEIYPEAGDGQKYTLDLCKMCSFELIKLLEREGYEIQENEWEY